MAQEGWRWAEEEEEDEPHASEICSSPRRRGVSPLSLSSVLKAREPSSLLPMQLRSECFRR